MIYLGPSAAKRWLRCTASPGYIDRNADRLPRQESAYADEGVDAHDHAGEALKLGGLYDYDTIPKKDMRKPVRDYVEFVLAQLEPGDEFIVETKAPLFYMPSRNGIVDACIVKPLKLVINDLKYGMGISVEAVENEQLSIYARSQVERLISKGHAFPPDFPVEMKIYQPRAQDGRVLREWTVTLTELFEFTDRIGKVASEILLNPDGGTFFPEEDEVCRFCDAKPICTVRAAALLGELPDGVVPVEALAVKESKPGFPSPDSLTSEQLGKVMAIRSDLVKWLDEVKEYGVGLIKAGQKVPGHKLVDGKGSRQWTSEEEAARVLGYRLSKDEIYPRKIISPAQAEELLKDRKLTTRLQNMLTNVIVKVEGAPTIVPESDKRPDISVSPTSVFTNLEDSSSLL